MRKQWFGAWLAIIGALLLVCTAATARNSPSAPLEGFVATNGVRLQYLDWGGAGPVLILVHGLGDDPYVFADLASGLTDRFHVIAYARRGSGSSDARGPYDVATLTEDLRGLMDALGIRRASLVGWSAGGNDVTGMAALYPERVSHVVYLDSGYDWSDPDFRIAFLARPTFERPASAMASFEAFRRYEQSMWYVQVKDMRPIDAYLRRRVVIQPDGSVKERLPQEVRDALYAALFASTPRDYLKLRCPVLAIYPDHWYPNDMLDADRREKALAYDVAFAPFRAKSIARVQREISNVEIVHVPGAHTNFIFVSRKQVLAALRRFLGEGPGK